MKKKILVMDDDPSLQEIFKLILEKAGYEVDFLSNESDILEDRYQVPDLFFLDKQLSGTDGLDICRHLKNHVTTKDIPVIIISATVGIGALAQKAGADSFIEKPFDKGHLLEVIKKHIR